MEGRSEMPKGGEGEERSGIEDEVGDSGWEG